MANLWAAILLLSLIALPISLIAIFFRRFRKRAKWAAVTSLVTIIASFVLFGLTYDKPIQQAERANPSRTNVSAKLEIEKTRTVGLELPPHSVQKTRTVGTGLRVLVDVDQNISESQCKALIAKYRNDGAPDGLVSVRKPSKMLGGRHHPWCFENFDGNGVTFDRVLFQDEVSVSQDAGERSQSKFKQRAEKANPSRVNFRVDPYSLELHQTYRVTRKTPLMPELQPRNPLEAISRIKQIPSGGLIEVLETSSTRGNPWYKVVAMNNHRNWLGSGWVNSTALLGQKLEQVSR